MVDKCVIEIIKRMLGYVPDNFILEVTQVSMDTLIKIKTGDIK